MIPGQGTKIPQAMWPKQNFFYRINKCRVKSSPLLVSRHLGVSHLNVFYEYMNIYIYLSFSPSLFFNKNCQPSVYTILHLPPALSVLTQQSFTASSLLTEHNIHYAHETSAQPQGMTQDWLKLITAISLPMMGLGWTCDPFLINKSKEFSGTVIKKALLFLKKFIGV